VRYGRRTVIPSWTWSGRRSIATRESRRRSRKRRPGRFSTRRQRTRSRACVERAILSVGLQDVGESGRTHSRLSRNRRPRRPARHAAFRPLRGNAKVFDPADRMHSDTIDRLVRKYAAKIGLARGYSAHSTRATLHHHRACERRAVGGRAESSRASPNWRRKIFMSAEAEGIPHRPTEFCAL
jgi:hypothetical protein